MNTLHLPSSLPVRRFARSIAAAWVACAPAIAHPLQTGAGAQASSPRAIFESASGALQTVPLESLDSTDPRRQGGHLVRFEGVARTLAPTRSDARARVELTSGDVVYGRATTGSGDRVELELIGGVKTSVSLDDLVSLTYPTRLEGVWTDAPKPAAEGDRVYRRQRDVLDSIDGGVEEFTAEGLTFHGSLVGEKRIPWSEIAALFIENTHSGAPSDGAADARASVVVELVDHSRVRGRLERLTRAGARVALSDGKVVELPVAIVAEIYVDDGSLGFLSALTPSRAIESSPFGDDLGMRWPHRVDASVNGTPLTAGGRVYARGIGVHAPSRIEWNLAGAWKTLRGAVAIDDQVLRLPARGSVVFRIHADGKLRWESAVVRGGEPPLALPAIDLTGVNELALEVDAGPDSFVADRANWLQMILVP